MTNGFFSVGTGLRKIGSVVRARLGIAASASLVLLLVLAPSLARASVKAFEGEITLPTYPWWPPVKHPYFRGTDQVNIYPYPMLDNLSREKTNRTYRTVVLENEYLRVTFLPELGGKVHEVIDKTTGYPMFYVNHVIKPGLIGQCGAWTSGGIEWNTGPQGHTVSAMQPVEVALLPPNRDGSRSVAIGETERIYGTKWTVVVTLRPGCSFLEERIRIYNPTEMVRPYYFWNCTAVPNTSGFRFIYPMTLGCDHSAAKFFDWPIDHGKDLSRGTNYQDASSIFAWYCNQDFFGSYDDDVERGVVAFANHHQVPGKKAWTWGHGGFGRMHQMDLTDDDGPYNEVQTGPLLTQGEVGRLEPCEAVSWQEWWYPIHGLGGFTAADKDLALNATVERSGLRLRLLGTGTWRGARVKVLRGENCLWEKTCDINPVKPIDLVAPMSDTSGPLQIEVQAGAELLGSWPFPLEVPLRTRPEKKPSPQTASEFVQAGWQEFLFARFPEAEKQFNHALELDAKCYDAQVGLAYLKLDSEPAKAAEKARAALAVNPDCGLAHYTLGVAEFRLGRTIEALDEGWKAALDPATAIAGRAFVANLLIDGRRWHEAVAALSEPGPWQTDSLCRNRLAQALRELGEKQRATELARQNLELDPLDSSAQSFCPGPTPSSKAAWANHVAQQAGLADVQWPYQYEALPGLQRAVQSDAANGKAALALGHLLFHLGRHAEGRAMWQRAAELGAEPVIACRALGMAAKTLDHDLPTARRWLEQASRADPTDAIVARDLAKTLFDLSDKAKNDAEKTDLTNEVAERLKPAFWNGKNRSDFIALFARAHNRLGQFAETGRLLDSVRITIWEGAHEVHDLFEEAHLALGKAQLESGHGAQALAEFDRALEYPENLATGKLEGARQAHIQYFRGKALEALGKKPDAIAAWRKAADEPASDDPKKQKAREQAAEALKQ